MKKAIRILSFLLPVLLVGAIPVQSKVYIDINAPAFQRFPIAITDFYDLGESAPVGDMPIWFSDIIGSKLDMTGFFRVIDKKAFLENPEKQAFTAADINFQDWSVLKVDFLLKGGFIVKDQDLTVEFRLYDVVEGRMILGRRYQGKLNDRLKMVLKFIDEMLVELTGESGVFDTKIAVVGKSGTTSEIYLIDFDDTNTVKLTNFKSLTMMPSWSPDGDYITFTSYRDGNPDHYVLRRKPFSYRRISAFNGLNLAGPWSPDGKKMLTVLTKDGNEEIYIRDFTNNSLKRITNNPAIDVSPVWSPDGENIAFVSDRSGSPQIFVMNADGGEVRRLTYEGNYNTSPSWSPKGNRIAFEGRAGGAFQIFTINEDGSGLVQVTFEPGGCEDPTWSPNGLYIAFATRQRGEAKVCIITANGLNFRPLKGARGISSFQGPSWSPHMGTP
ncbi:MAG: Tol-Pal system beta propeller repeat protein TolB [Deltaproteobacteria bacterium]|nr:Tol-Pal system beta propeller repeat protein TolB [Deltaproteobacteria bacterium]